MNSGTPSSTAPGPFPSAGIRRPQAARRKVHSSPVKYLCEEACVEDVLSAEIGAHAAIEKVGTSAIILRRKSRRPDDFSDLLTTISNYENFAKQLLPFHSPMFPSSVVLLIVTIVSISLLSVVMIAPLITLPFVPNLLGIVASRQIHPWPLPRFRVYPNITLITIIIPTLRVVLIGINLHCFRKCRNNNHTSSMMASRKAYGASCNEKCGNQCSNHCFFHGTSC